MFKDLPDGLGFFISIVIGTTGAVWSLAWWLSGQFSTLRHLMYEQILKTEEQILSKLEYHEKHDDRRFDDLKRDLWEVKLRAVTNRSDIRELEKKNEGQ